MSTEEIQLRIGKLVQEYGASKIKLQLLQDEACREAKVVDGFVEFLRSGGARGQIDVGMPLEHYLSSRVAKLIGDLQEARQQKSELRDSLSVASGGVTVE